MANSVIKIQFETRPCKVKGKDALFHMWSNDSKLVYKSEMIGGNIGGTVSKTLGIIEYVEDGKVCECFPEEIKFLDTTVKASKYSWESESE